jgi:hypothetical protein
MSFLPCRSGKDFPHALEEGFGRKWLRQVGLSAPSNSTIRSALPIIRRRAVKSDIANWATGGSQKFDEADKRMRLGP